VITAGCSRGSRDNPDLAVLRAQRIATEPMPGTADGNTQEVAGGTALGKPVHAVLSRLLHLAAGSDQRSVLAAAVATAERDGWVVESPPAAGGAWLLTKTDQATRLELDVSVQTVDGAPSLVINLANAGPVA
jgi:hypothetical protein